MISAGIIIVLTLLFVANIFLLVALAYSGKGQKNIETKIGFGFMTWTLVLDMLFMLGGVLIW